MPQPLFVAQSGGARVYKVGRVGWDPGDADTGGAYTGVIETEDFPPLGPDGFCYFRRVALRIWRTGAFTLTMKVWVDGARTTVWEDGVQVEQTIVISEDAPAEAPDEIVVEGQITASGTSIRVQISVDSDDVTGVFLPESLEVHLLPLREALQKADNAEAE